MAQSCVETRPEFACYTNTAGERQTVLVHIVYKQGIPVGQAFATAQDPANPITVDFAGGETVTAGECPVASPDVEWQELCDKQTDGTVIKFYCRTITSFDATGAVVDPVQVDNFEADKVTPYTPTGTIGDCVECEDTGSLGTFDDWSVLS